MYVKLATKLYCFPFFSFLFVDLFTILGWTVDPQDRPNLGPRLMDMEAGCFEIRSELDFVLHFLPMEYLRSTVIPATNNFAAKNKAATWTNLDHNEFLHFLGILLSMEVVDRFRLD